MEPVKLPDPVPLGFLLSAMVGFGLVLQHIPRVVMAAPPSLVLFPPLVAVVEVRADIEVVVITGKIAATTAVTSFP